MTSKDPLKKNKSFFANVEKFIQGDLERLNELDDTNTSELAEDFKSDDSSTISGTDEERSFKERSELELQRKINLFQEPGKGLQIELNREEIDKKKKHQDILDHHERKKIGLQVDILNDLVKTRRKYTVKVFNLLKIWLVCVGLIIIFDAITLPTIGLHGVRLLPFGSFGQYKLYDFGQFEISDTVILGIIGGTTANVIGMFIIVLRYLFPNVEKSKNKQV